MSSFNIALRVPGLDGLSLVILALSGSQPDEQLDPAIHEVDLQWHDGESSLPGTNSPLLDLTLVRLQDPGPCRLML